MASMEEKAAGTCTPASDVGEAFIFQYYNVLHQCPELGYQFYQDISKVLRPEENGQMIITTTMEGIKEKILSIGYSEPACKTEVISVDSQDSYNGGIIVAVTGYITLKDKLRRKFAQIFFLAPQDKGYFVLTDVLRYVDDNGLQLVTDVFQASSNFETDNSSKDEAFEKSIDVNGEVYNTPKSDQTAIVVETPGMEVVEVPDKPQTMFESSLTSSSSFEMAEVPGKKVAEVPGKKVAEGPEKEVAEGPEKKVTEVPRMEVAEVPGKEVVGVTDKSQAMFESSLTSSSSLQMVEVPGVKIAELPDKSKNLSESSSSSEVPKKTYASILKAKATRPSAPGSSAVRSAPSTQNHLVATASPPVNVSKPLASDSKATGNGNQLKTEDHGCSIYLKDLPMSATHSLIENELKKFGSIKRNSIQIRTNKGFSFGFVEFEVRNAMQRAIEASPILINGHQVVIEEKRSTNQGNARGRFPSARGRVYRNEGGRGYGNFTNGTKPS